VLYVWFDAPIGYISATQEWALKEGQPDKWKEYWLDPKTKLVNFVGKDNIPFHAAIFPAMVMGQNLPYKLVDELPANEFFNLEGRQFSKSDGWAIDLEDFFKRYTADQIRYAIAANAPETSDAEFTWKDFQNRCNGELLGKYGNLVNRVLVFARSKGIDKVPSLNPLSEGDGEFLQKVKTLADQAAQAYDGFKLRRASQLVMELAQMGNVYFDTKKPWQNPQPATTIACCLECLKTLALISYPIIPETAQKVWQMLGFTKPLQQTRWSEVLMEQIPENQPLQAPTLLFNKIENAQIDGEVAKLHEMSAQIQKAQNPVYEPLKEEIDIDFVRKLDLRVGLIEKATPVPKSKKLLQLEVDLGFEKRTILSGISQHYTPEQLIGKKVVIVANLKPATLMGIQSQGMVLAGSLDNALEVLQIQSLPPGSAIS